LKKPKTYKPKFGRGKKVFKKAELSARQKGYDTVWEKYRFRFLHYNPNCYSCPNKATVVDHLIAHKGDSELFRKLDNHVPLCKQCHDTITGKFDRHKEQDLVGKLKWLQEKREHFNMKSKVKVLGVYEK